MIKPEMKLISLLEWKHGNWLMLPEYKLCNNTQVAYVKYINPETKEIIKTQLMCPSCYRILEVLNGKKD